MENVVRKKKKIEISQIILAIVIGILLFLALFQLLIMLIKCVKSPSQEIAAPFTLTFPFRWKNFSDIWNKIDKSFLNTFIIAIGTTFLLLLFSSFASYGLTRYRIPCKQFVVMMFLAVVMVPGVLTLIPQYQLVTVTYGLANNYLGVILPVVAGQLPMAIFLLNGFFGGIEKEIFEAGTIDGASNARMYFALGLPLSMPILITQGLMTFMGAYNDYLWPLLILREESMRTTAIMLVYWTDELYRTTMSMNVAIAGYVLASVPMLILFSICSKQFVAGLTSGAVKM